MARPIEPTPVIRGKDALRFIQSVRNPKPYEPPVIDLQILDKVVVEFLERNKHVQK